MSSDNTSESTKSSKNPSILNHSSELIKSTNVDFNVYSIYADYQNVFFINGARKPPKLDSNLTLANLKLTSPTRVPETNIKKQAITIQQPKQSNSCKSEKRAYSGRHISAGPLKLGSSSGANSSGINTRRRAAQASAHTTTTTTALSSTINSGINNSLNPNANPNSNNNSNSSYLFSNNDDLYEI